MKRSSAKNLCRSHVLLAMIRMIFRETLWSLLDNVFGLEDHLSGIILLPVYGYLLYNILTCLTSTPRRVMAIMKHCIIDCDWYNLQMVITGTNVFKRSTYRYFLLS